MIPHYTVVDNNRKVYLCVIEYMLALYALEIIKQLKLGHNSIHTITCKTAGYGFQLTSVLSAGPKLHCSKHVHDFLTYH